MVNKENIKPFKETATTLINDVPIVQFNYEGDRNIKIGYIPNEVDPPFTDSEKVRFEQGNCIAILIKAVQELTSRVERLEIKKEVIGNGN